MVKFESLPEEKQLAVLNAAFSCFGKNGYKKTSVSDIAADAGIAKASIFQYFGSKKELYIYLFQYSCEKITNETPVGTEDFFECIRIGSDTKMRVMARYPGMYDFLSSFIVETDESVVEEIRQYSMEVIQNAMGGLFKNVNWNMLKQGVDRNMLINMVRWVNEGYLRESIGKKDVDTLRSELFGHLELIKSACYKEEYL